jgi:ribose-phosphate pyrophosphokinase
MTDTIQPSESALKSKKIRVLPMSPLLGEAIRRIANEESVSKLFDR